MAASAIVRKGADAVGEASGLGAPPGLVICAKTRGLFEGEASSAYRPSFPTADLLHAAAGLFAAREPWQGEEGPRPRLVIAPGCIAVEAPDLAKRERATERARHRRQREADLRAAYLAAGDEYPDGPAVREVASWSRKSRANMVRALCELDYSALLGTDRVPAMVTLTYPGDWLTVAPDGRSVKAHVDAFRKRFRAAWGAPLLGVWKLEFQRRGAPHLHVLTVPPHGVAAVARRGARAVGAGLPFHAWVSLVWADVVGHPDADERARHERAGTGVDFAEGLRARDPKRVAVYFTKHGSYSAKGYQNVVPEAWRAPGKGPGRFWGYWGLERATVAVELDEVQVVNVVRTLRRMSRAAGVTREVVVSRGGQRRRVRRRVSRLSQGRGWLSVNDGASLASQLARYVEVCCAGEQGSAEGPRGRGQGQGSRALAGSFGG